MRGDSLRDLYAKTLAVFGLGLLAGAGALVDYWPVGIHYPAVASTFSPSQLLPLSLVVHPADATSQSSWTPASFAAVQSAAPVVPAFSTIAADAPALPLGETVALVALAPEADAPQPMAVVARVEAPAADAWRLDDGDVLWSDASFPATGLAAASASDEHHEGAGGRGFVSGALSKTTTSLVRTGRWTGTSIVSAVRVVRDVVGRAIPD